jgi:hypothetical protein
MKRILLVAAVLFSISMGAMAQSAKSALQFVDYKGNVIADGAVFEVTEVTVDTDFGGTYMKPDLLVKNVSNSNQVVGLKFDLTSMPCGRLQSCPNSCSSFENPGIEYSSSVEVKSGASQDIATEWFPPEEGTTAKTWTVTITAGLCKKGAAAYEYAEDGPSVKVKFIYDPTGIETVNSGNVTEVVRYNAQGQKISKPCKGINIIKLSNGKTVKKLIP